MAKEVAVTDSMLFANLIEWIKERKRLMGTSVNIAL